MLCGVSVYFEVAGSMRKQFFLKHLFFNGVPSIKFFFILVDLIISSGYDVQYNERKTHLSGNMAHTEKTGGGEINLFFFKLSLTKKINF